MLDCSNGCTLFFFGWLTVKYFLNTGGQKKKQRHYFVNKGLCSQDYGFSSSHVWIWELDYKEDWAPRNWCFWTVVLEKTLENPLHCKEIQPVHPKGDQSWVFMGRNDVEAETPILWPPDMKSWLIWKDWERLKVGGEGDDRGWDGWTASPSQWTWVWVNSRNWWWTGRPGVLWFMGSQRVGHNWVTEVNWRYDNSIFVMWAPPHNIIFRRCKLHYLGVKCHAVSMHTILMH